MDLCKGKRRKPSVVGKLGFLVAASLGGNVGIGPDPELEPGRFQQAERRINKKLAQAAEIRVQISSSPTSLSDVEIDDGVLVQSPSTRLLDQRQDATISTNKNRDIFSKIRHTAKKIIHYDINAKDKEGLTMLMRACSESKPLGRQLQMLELLLKDNWIDVNATDDRYGSTALIKACAIKNIKFAGEFVPLLLSHEDIDVNIKNKYGYTALMQACAHENDTAERLEVVRLLLKQDIDVNAQDKFGLTALMGACWVKNGELVNELISHGANVNIHSEEGDTALWYACEGRGGKDIVEILLREGANINHQEKDKRTILMRMCTKAYAKDESGHNIDNVNDDSLEIVHLLLKQPEININLKNTNGDTALIKACSDPNDAGLEFVQALVTHKDIDIDAVDAELNTALIIACDMNNVRIVKVLLAHGAQFNLRNKYSESPLWKACAFPEGSGLEVVRALLMCPGIDVNTGDNNGSTPLMEACQHVRNGGYYIVKELLKSEKLEVNTTVKLDMKRQDNAFWFACKRGGMEVAKLLLGDPRLNVNHTFEEKRTALIELCSGELDGWDEQVIKALCHHPKIDVNLIDKDGDTALIKALSSKCSYDLLCTLRYYGKADPNIQDKNGRTALMLVCHRARKLESKAIEDEHFDKQLSRKQELKCLRDIKLFVDWPGIDVNKQDKEGNTALIIACGMFDRRGIVRAILSHRLIDVNVKNKHGMTALMVACSSYKRLPIIKMLLKHSSLRVNTPNKEEDTALLIANRSPYSQLEMISLLLTVPNLDINAADRYGTTVLLSNCETEKIDVVKRLLAVPGININKKYGEKQRTILMQMVEKSKKDLIHLFINHPNIDFSVRDRSNQTVLDIAVSKNNIVVLQRILEHMKSNKLKRRSEATRLLFKALKDKRSLPILKCLLANNVDPNAIDETKQLLLPVALDAGNKEFTNLLLLLGADVKKEDIASRNALQYAVDELDVLMLITAGASFNDLTKFKTEHNTDVPYWIANRTISEQKLIDRINKRSAKLELYCKAHICCLENWHKCLAILMKFEEVDLNACDPVGNTPLQVACLKGHTEIVDMLLARNVDLGTVNKCGDDALSIAVKGNHPVIVARLLEHKPLTQGDPAYDRASAALLFACSHGHLKVVQLLVEAGVTSSYNDGTALHIAAARGKVEVVEYLLQKCDPNKFDAVGYRPSMLAAENEHYKLVKMLHANGYPVPNNVLTEHRKRSVACFQVGTAVITAEENADYTGWLFANKERLDRIQKKIGGVLLVAENDPRPIVHIPAKGAFGVLVDDNVVFNGKTEPIEKMLHEVKFFYGLPEIQKNIVWKRMDADPTLYLNYYTKVKGSLKPLNVLTRTCKGGVYQINHLISPAEVLDIIGKQVIDSVFTDTEVLCLRNVYGEGTSLTHDEWDFMSRELAYFPADLTKALLDDDSRSVDQEMQPNKEVEPEIKPVLENFVMWLIKEHPLDKDLRVCNKLVPFLKDGNEQTHKTIAIAADKLHKDLEDQTRTIYKRCLENCNIDELVGRVKELIALADKKKGITKLKQTELTKIPSWFGPAEDADIPVDPCTLVRLFLQAEELKEWKKEKRTLLRRQATKTKIIDYLHNKFFAEFKPTYDDLLAKGYIKVARALKEQFHSQLLAHFFPDNVKIAPVKELSRCKAKLGEYKREGKCAPYSAWVCDYLRATILCGTLQGMVSTVEILMKQFRVVRIKQRIGPNDDGNKVILINLVVEDKENKIKPNKYSWSDWWDTQKIQMIAEVQIAHKDLFYLDKQAHSSYEIARAGSCAEWEHQQGFHGVEQEIFPMSPLHNDPLCLM